MKSGENLRELSKLHDTCINQIRNIGRASVEINNYGEILFAILVKLIPEEIVFEFNRSAKGEDS